MGAFAQYFKNLFNPVSADEESKRKEFILNILLAGSIALALIAMTALMANIIQGKTRGSIEKQSLLTLVFFLFLFLFVLSKKGFYKISAYLLIFAYLVPSFYELYKWGSNLPTMLMALSLIIIMSGILISSRFAFIISLLVSIALFLLAYGQQTGIIVPELYWVEEQTPLVGDALVHVIIFVIIAAISWLYNREINQSLKRALDSEAALKNERDLLEIKVETRTRELKRTQLEKMIQVERFSEFGKIASGIFHDLANPLTVVSLNLEMLYKQSKHHEVIGVENMQSTLKTVLQATKRMEGFINSVKKQFMAEEESAMFNIAEEIKQAIDIISCKAKQKEVEIIFFNKLEHNLAIFGNPLKFNQVVTNLLSNAIDSYSGEVKNRDNRIVALAVSVKNGSVEIAVEDKGSGVKDEDRPKIFDLFFTTKEAGEGTGVGLATVKNIVEHHFGGAVSFQSKHCDGSIFIVSLPIKRQTDEG